MLRWVPTATLGRAFVVAAAALCGSVLLGDPVVAALGAPFAVLAAMALLRRPRTDPVVGIHLDHTTLHEGQGTASRVFLTGAGDVEQATRMSGQAHHLALDPVHGLASAVVRVGDDRAEVPGLTIAMSPRRWGRRMSPVQRVALWSPWAGFRWVTGDAVGQLTRTLPVAAPFATRAEMPRPVGLVGAHRSRTSGTGTELAGIRPFTSGDRLRRIDWRVSLRSGELHVVDTRAEQDAGVLLVIDATADHGASGGVDGAASSLDVTVRAAAAVAEQLTRRGDRVALRVLGGRATRVGFGSGHGHLLRIREALITVTPGAPKDLGPRGPVFHAREGTIVLVFSPMLDDLAVSAAGALTRRGLAVLVVDTLPEDATAQVPEGGSVEVAQLAWRMRRTERDVLLDQLARAGCPVVAWRGPGTLDDVLRRLARRGQVPSVRSRGR